MLKVLLSMYLLYKCIHVSSIEQAIKHDYECKEQNRYVPVSTYMYITLFIAILIFYQKYNFLLIPKHSTYLLMQLQSCNLFSSVTVNFYVHERSNHFELFYIAYDVINNIHHWYLFDILLAQNCINWSSQVSTDVKSCPERMILYSRKRINQRHNYCKENDNGALLGWKVPIQWVNYDRRRRSPPLDCSLKLLIDGLNSRCASAWLFKNLPVEK